ncbi:ComF family protein [Microcoleus sp. FACHB-831]|nr:ComF family protein [Microcoleus sp. FACHB-831]
MGFWGKKLSGLMSVFLQASCPLCQRATSSEFCQYCDRQLQSCQLPNPSQFWQCELPVFAWGVYGGAIKRAIAALKYDNQPQLARPLSQWLAEAWLKSSLSIPHLTVVPIPMYAKKQQQRGYNQADLLAQYFCDYTKLPLQQLGLERVRETEALFGLSASGREQTLMDCFALGKGFKRRRPTGSVLLLDDIYTTGATARAAAETLKQQGIKVYGLVAIATPPRTRQAESKNKN